jgi:hypothetical protein
MVISDMRGQTRSARLKGQARFSNRSNIAQSARQHIDIVSQAMQLPHIRNAAFRIVQVQKFPHLHPNGADDEDAGTQPRPSAECKD